MKTLIQIPDELIQQLGVICNAENISRSEAIRRAIQEYTSHHKSRNAITTSVFGLWKSRRINSLEYETTLRKEWEKK